MNGHDPKRIARLNKVFQTVISGKTSISPSNAPLFLEAISKHSNPTECFTAIVTSSSGLQALQNSLQYDLSPKFFNSQVLALVRSLQDKELAAINNGLVLTDIITKLSAVNIFWMEFLKVYLKGDLDEGGILSFGWLLWRLCLLPSGAPSKIVSDADMTKITQQLTSSMNDEICYIGRKIRDVQTTSQPIDTVDMSSSAPGGRHDNDHADFRQISIMPTQLEIQCTSEAFLRPSSFLEDPATEPSRVAMHLDNQFRLLREEMVSEMKEEFNVATGKKKGHHRGVKINGLSLIGIECGPEGKRDKWGLVCVCDGDLPQLEKCKGQKERLAYLTDKSNFFKHQSLICLLAGKNIIGFATINRDEQRLIKNPPQIVLQFEDAQSIKRVLYNFKLQNELTLIQINTAVFAFEPVLNGLQQAKTLPLSSELLLWKQDDPTEEVEVQANIIVQALRLDPGSNLKSILNTPKDIKLDSSQARSLISGLTRKVALIQGPPGTGKSFIGALVAKAIHDFTEQTILVVCYTNHALDDILEGLLDIGIPETGMLRLGGKSTSRTEPLTLSKQARGSNRSRSEWQYIDEFRAQLEALQLKFDSAFSQFMSSNIRLEDILDLLEFEEADSNPSFHKAFEVPASEDGFQVVGSDNKAVGPDYLLDRWASGQDAGVFISTVCESEDCKAVWDIPPQVRREHLNRWKDALLRESIDEVQGLAKEYNSCHQRLTQARRSDTAGTLQNKRIVGCTTTAAAKYREEIQVFNPNVLLVEEAGEILESHVLTSLGPQTSQMILIGDHKQLRPKVNDYKLTVEKGDGFDLNRSLFERLILKEYPHESLSQQHRMRPEISALIRRLTYPELVDAPKTQNRPHIRGVQDSIVFINHEHLEDEFKQLADRSDMASTSSKQNSYEATMILKIVRYLGQQGYGTNELVVLTPYLGQLQKLRESLKKENDPILNDLDSYELIRAGLLDPAAGKLKKKPIRLATIDNYQGEESDIVIVSLTRSNPKCDIGFMFSPERLNVLLSRARNGLIMLGNANTFKGSRKGKELWRTLFDMLSDGKHVYQGLPVRCERHIDTTATLFQPDDFDTHCPDGGCVIPCGSKLPCGIHVCVLKCHQQNDHSKTECFEKMSHKCSVGHSQVYICSKGPPTICDKCERAKKLAKKQMEQDLAEQQSRDEEQKAHLAAMDALDAQIKQKQVLHQHEELRRQRELAIAQKRKDLDNMDFSFPTSPSPTPPFVAPSSMPSSSVRNSLNISSSPPILPLQQQSSEPSSTTPLRTTFPQPVPSSTSPPPVSSGNGDDSLLSKMWNAVSAFSASSKPMDKSSSKPSSNLGKPFKRLPESPSKQDWEHRKNFYGASNDAIDAIMEMTGLEDVKAQVLKFLSKIETSARQKVSLKRERFNVVFLGNPGTGKTTIARHYAKFLASVKVIPAATFEERTGALLAHEGVNGAQKLLDDVTKSGGGVIFIDEAYQLTSGNNPGGAAVLDYLLAEMENRVGTLVFILAGYNKEMEKFFEHNPGLKSRVPFKFLFADYLDEELMSMFNGMLQRTFSGGMKVEGGVEGLYGRIVIRRLGRRRGQPGFGNARDLENVLSTIRERQAFRLTKERRTGRFPDDFLFTAQDLIGPDPAAAILESEAWVKLQELIGLKAVKDAVSSIIGLLGENYKRELSEKEPMAVSLNRVFLGSPGTGKTTVAQLYGKILVDIGLLSNGEVVLKNPADFVGAVLGASESNTKAILANSAGKVLIIDEAYMLYGGGGNDSAGGQSNQFKTSVIDTIVAEVQSTPGEDRCVLLLGYKEQMIEMFQNVNPGLSRRFKIEDAFNFEDFTNDELLQILQLKLKQQDLDVTGPAKKVAIELLSRMRNRPNFGNAGEVENLITQAKTRAVARRQKMSESDRPADIVFTSEDFDPDYNREANASANLAKLFEGIVGHESVIQKLANYQEIARACKARNMDPREQVPTNFIFTGPPGTGKTTIARKVGQVFYDMGLLSSAEVIEASASDLVGQYVGQTGPKTKKLFDKALGKVLFVDEAYRLSEGHFAQEAIDELVGLLTHPTYKAKLIVVLAGYEQDMSRLMSVNTGLASRFPHQVVFQNMSAEDCLKVIEKELKKSSVVVEGWEEDSSDFVVEMKELLRDLAELPDWGNARDMVTLSKEMSNKALLRGSDKQESLKIPAADVLGVVKEMIDGRKRRAQIPRKHRQVVDLPKLTFVPDSTPPPSTSIGTSTSQETARPPPPPTDPRAQADPRADRGSERRRGRGGTAPRGGNQDRGRGGIAPRGGNPDRGRGGLAHRGGNLDRGRGGLAHRGGNPDRGRGGPAHRGGNLHRGRGGTAHRGGDQDRGQRNSQVADAHVETQGQRQDQGSHPVERDPGVSDAVWNQLKAAKRAADAAERLAREELKAMQNRLGEQRRKEEEAKRRLQELERAAAEAKELERRAELERQREEARRQVQAAFEAKLRAEAEVRAKLEAERRKREEEERVQRKLQQMGNCVAGFQWIKMGSYYRCAGGSHTVSTSQLGL